MEPRTLFTSVLDLTRPRRDTRITLCKAVGHSPEAVITSIVAAWRATRKVFSNLKTQGQRRAGLSYVR